MRPLTAASLVVNDLNAVAKLRLVISTKSLICSGLRKVLDPELATS